MAEASVIVMPGEPIRMETEDLRSGGGASGKLITVTFLVRVIDGETGEGYETEQIGITDVAQPDYGQAVPIQAGEIPVFWACGVTPQAVLMASKPPLAITHSPGCMFVTDRLDRTLAGG